MIVRKTLRVLAIGGLLALSTAACGDKTVSTPPAASSNTTWVGTDADTNADTNTASGRVSDSGGSVAVNAADDARLDEVDQMLRDIEADLGAADQDATTPEGDPTR